MNTSLLALEVYIRLQNKSIGIPSWMWPEPSANNFFLLNKCYAIEYQLAQNVH